MMECPIYLTQYHDALYPSSLSHQCVDSYTIMWEHVVPKCTCRSLRPQFGICDACEIITFEGCCVVCYSPRKDDDHGVIVLDGLGSMNLPYCSKSCQCVLINRLAHAPDSVRHCDFTPDNHKKTMGCRCICGKRKQ